MVSVHILHKYVVCLIKHVGTVSVGTVQFQVGIFVHVGVHSLNVLPCVFFIEGVEQVVQVTFLFCRVVFQHTYDDFFVFFTGGKGKQYAHRQ